MEANVRIDKGIKRGPKGMKPAELPKLKLKPSTVENETRQLARNAKGQLTTSYSPEQRESAVDAVIDALERGLTVAEIATQHGISVSTLHSWVVADNRATTARSTFYARQIANAIGLIEAAPNPLELARGRELARAWHQTAAVRDPANYGPKNYVTIENVGDLGDKLRRARERTIEGECTNAAEQQLPAITDKSPNNQ